jgi:hypothetical protein
MRNYAVLHIVADESRIFKTKERAPVMLTLEVYRPIELSLQSKPSFLEVNEELAEEQRFTAASQLVLEPQRQRKVGGSFVGMHSEAFNPYMNEYSPIDTALTMKQTAAQRRESEQRRKESVNEQNEYKKMIKMTGDKQIKAFDILADRTASRAI